jgi:hypothetical protein
MRAFSAVVRKVVELEEALVPPRRARTRVGSSDVDHAPIRSRRTYRMPDGVLGGQDIEFSINFQYRLSTALSHL